MIEWLKLTPDQRRSTINDIEYMTGIYPKAIEKDWWVTLSLKALFQGAYGKHMIFKGGTSLSKCWNLIYRFSEDIDIALSPEAFGMEYNKKPSSTYVNRLKRKGCLFTSNELKADLEKQFSDFGVPDGTLEITAAPVPPELPDTDPQTLIVKYPPLYEPHSYIADEVKIEVSVRSFNAPFSGAQVKSILSQHPSEKFKEEPFVVSAMDSHKTFLEKVFLLHEEFGRPDRSRIRSERMSRHLYDLTTMMDTDTEKLALDADQLYADLISHRSSYQRIGWVDYESMRYESISFVPPDDVIELYRKDYKTMREEMIYEKAMSFEEVIEKLKALQGKFRAKGIK